jgi:alpha-glucan phosphorylase-like protein
MEYGLHECLPLYSGGLGVLAGDHLKSASDMGLPLVAVGLFYREGYFQQRIEHGQQIADYPRVDPDELPIRPVEKDGKRLLIEVPEAHASYQVQAWEVQVGRVKLFLLDSGIKGASPWHQQYSRRLYGGNNDTRIAQEIMLGIGGVRLLRALGYDPVAFHMNEGHAAFLSMEMVREGLARGLSPEDALAAGRKKTIFTTHTPVLAGHDRFTWDQVQASLAGYREGMGLPGGFFMDLGRIRPGDVGEPLCNTILALRTSRTANAVSALHGEVTRDMWKELYEDRYTSPVGGRVATPKPAPITHVTNGVHPKTWMAPAVERVLSRWAPAWDQAWLDPQGWAEAVEDIPAEALWEARRQGRRALLEWMASKGQPYLNPEALTIGFARRFAPYKRASLMFTDPDRLAAILDAGPCQIVVAGKAHPADLRGQSIISEIAEWAAQPRFKGRVVLLPNYNMKAGRLLVQGCDLWLNTPRRPYEASGTSGQKAALQGVLQLSILDGWWAEAWDDTHGWAIKPQSEGGVTHEQDARDAEALYTALEDQVLPAWKTRNGSGIPTTWVKRMRQSIAECLPRFDSRRMVAEYAQLYGGV